MSGHSKWSTIKHKKAATDAKKGRLFSHLVKEIIIAARHGGGDANSNLRLRQAIQAAKNANVPSDNIKRAILRGTGELPGVSYEEVSYEGYGPGGAAVLIECLTDNKNRTVGEVRSTLSKHGGNLGEAGCVSWMFEKKGLIMVEAEGLAEDRLMDLILEAGAEDFKLDGDVYHIITAPESFEQVRGAVARAKFAISSAELSMVPKNTVTLDAKTGGQMLRLMEKFEEMDDVQNIYSNFDIPDEVMEQME